MKSSAPIKSLVLDNNDESEEDNKSLKSQKSLRQVKVRAVISRRKKHR